MYSKVLMLKLKKRHIWHSNKTNRSTDGRVRKTRLVCWFEAKCRGDIYFTQIQGQYLVIYVTVAQVRDLLIVKRKTVV